MQRYNLEQTPKTASPSDFELYLGTGKWVNVKQTSEFKLDTKILNGLGKGCIHPRKALINDFNLDGMQDIFIICHGWDKHPYTGEISKLILSQKNNRYKIIDASAKKGFGTVLDALVTGDFGDKTVWILRTSGGNNTFYKGICIQEYHLNSQSSNLFYCERDRNWFPWLIFWKSWDKKTYIGSSNLKDDFRLLLER